MAEAFVSGDVLHLACGICPSRRFPVGGFDVVEKPSKECPFNPVDGHRYAADGTPVCVHPDKVGLPTGRYKSLGEPVMVRVVLPADEAELVPYLRDLLYGAAPMLLEDLIEQASAEMRDRFPGVDVLGTLRRALS